MRVVKDGPHAADERFAGDGAAKGKKVRKVRLSAQSYYALRGRVACRLGWSRAPNSDSNYSAVQIVCYLVVVICATNRQPLLGAALQHHFARLDDKESVGQASNRLCESLANRLGLVQKRDKAASQKSGALSCLFLSVSDTHTVMS
jgi:hypothetical protein